MSSFQGLTEHCWIVKQTLFYFADIFIKAAMPKWKRSDVSNSLQTSYRLYSVCSSGLSVRLMGMLLVDRFFPW